LSLFFEACRGTQLDHGVNVTDDKGDTVQIQRIPVQADFLHMYSSAPGQHLVCPFLLCHPPSTLSAVYHCSIGGYISSYFKELLI